VFCRIKNLHEPTRGKGKKLGKVARETLRGEKATVFKKKQNRNPKEKKHKGEVSDPRSTEGGKEGFLFRI